MRPPKSLVHVLLTTAIALTVTPAKAAPDIVAAGDIACGGKPCRAQKATARLIGRTDPRAVLALGDNQYPNGSLSAYRTSYDPTWGRFKQRTHPTPGNHEYQVAGARGYFTYFGRRARPRANGTYSFELGRWHILSINSGRGHVRRRQLAWIRRDLRTDRHRCELAFWHHPRWSSGTEHGSYPAMGRLWRVLFRAGVDVALNGHEHNYERFHPMTPKGRLSGRRGIRQFVVGTGGAGLYPLRAGIHGSARRIDDRFGVLRLVLRRSMYAWRFMGVGGVVLDRGAHRCHG